MRRSHFEASRVNKILQCREERRRIIKEEEEGGSQTHLIEYDQPTASHQRVQSAKPGKK